MTFDPLLWLLVAVAPLPYWVVGLPWVARTPALRLAPVFGLGVVGLFAELGLMSGVGATAAVIAGLIVSAVLVAVRPPAVADLLSAIREGYALYLVALVPATLSPFPVLGVWSGDWLHMYDSGQAVWRGGEFTPALLERPPLGGAIAVPLWLVRDGLASYQLATAVASAALLAVVVHGVRQWGGVSAWAAVPAVAGSMFFLHHTAAAWVKPLAAASVVAAVLLGGQARRDGFGWWRAAVAFALAVAEHQSSVLYAGFILIPAVTPWDGLVRVAVRLGVLALAGLFVSFGFEAWTIATYGLDAKVKANPSVAQRQSDVSFAANTALVGLSSVVPWGNAEEVHRAVVGGRADLSKNGYWVATGWLTATAGTVLGLMLPFVPVWRGVFERYRALPGVWWLAAVAAFLGNAVLCPFYSPMGTAQAGLVPLELFLVIGLAVCVTATTPARRRWVNRLTVALAVVPFVFVNAGVAAALTYSGRFRDVFAAGSEGDWTQSILPRGLEPLGVATFPLGVVLLAVVGVMWWRRP